MFSLVLQHMVVSASKHISIILISAGRGGKRKGANKSHAERRVGEDPSEKAANDSFTSDQLGTSANFVSFVSVPLGCFLGFSPKAH